MGQISFRLVKVVIADKIGHRVFGEKLFKLAIKLGRQGFVVGKDQRRSLQFLNHMGHREGFTRAGYPQKGLPRNPVLHASGQLGDSLRLVAGGCVVGNNFEFHGFIVG